MVVNMNRVKIVNVYEVPKQRVENGVNTWIKVLFSVDEMPTFSMRIFEMDEGGYIEAHSHPWEHEILVLEGELKVSVEDEEHYLKPFTAIYIPPNKVHSYRNIYKGRTVFLCTIPIKPTT
ncbi:MAG: cupin domain-containing protein [Ignisphaera sp.]